MKLKSISLIAALALGTYAGAADSLEGMFKEGTLKGQLKAFYFDRDTAGSDANITSLGVKLDYQTAALNGFKLGLGVQTSNSPWSDDDGEAKFKGDMYGDGAVLSQAYLAYKLAKTNLKIGRQYIKMPLIKGSGSRLIVQSFEGATVVSKDLPKTTLMGAYVTKFQHRTDGAGDIAEFTDTLIPGNASDKNAYQIAVKNNSIAGTTLTAAYGEYEDSHNLYYLEANYKNKLDAFTYNVAAQYSATDYDNGTDADYYGLKFGVGLGGLNAYVAYAEVQDGTAQYSVAGHGAKKTIFTTADIDAGEYKESEQYAVDVNYNFKAIKTKIGARYVNVDYANNTEADWTDLYASYKFSGALKGLSANVVYEDKDLSTSATDDKELWVKLVYSF